MQASLHSELSDTIGVLQQYQNHGCAPKHHHHMNILLMGPPGAGKTTVGKIVARKLGLPAVDVDDDVLETTWKMPVAAKLAAVGGERFLQEEGQALCSFSASGCVVSLTGSNPLHSVAMQHVKRTGLVIYLDVDSEDIIQRLSRMKVNRIVGQEAGVSTRDILCYRKQFYEKWLDVRVLCGRGETVEEVAEKVLQAVERYQNYAAETYVSTRGHSQGSCSQKTHFSDVAVEGLATDGGLYIPKNGSKNNGVQSVVYHSSAYLDLCRDGVIRFGEPTDVCIPTGNFGNALSAVYAKQMGLPIRKVICASNHNRIVADFMTTGEYDLRGRPLMLSHSPALDILKSSNLERFIYHASGGDSRLVKELFMRLDRRQHFRVPESLLGRIQQEVLASWCCEDDCLAAIHSVHSQVGYIMDPHTAVAKVVADRLRDGSCPTVLCSTAHYGKFAPSVLQALQLQNISADPVEQLKTLESTASEPEMHRELMKCIKGSGRRTHSVCEADHSVLVEEVESMIHDSFLKVM